MSPPQAVRLLAPRGGYTCGRLELSSVPFGSPGACPEANLQRHPETAKAASRTHRSFRLGLHHLARRSSTTSSLNVFEDRKAGLLFSHDREMEVARRARFVEYLLRLLQIEGLVLALTTARTYAQQPGARQFEVRDDVFHYRTGSRSPLFRILVVDVHVPVSQRFFARPKN